MICRGKGFKKNIFTKYSIINVPILIIIFQNMNRQMVFYVVTVNYTLNDAQSVLVYVSFLLISLKQPKRQFCQFFLIVFFRNIFKNLNEKIARSYVFLSEKSNCSFFENQRRLGFLSCKNDLLSFSFIPPYNKKLFKKMIFRPNLDL